MGIKSNELKPTKENLINTIKRDSISRNKHLKRFVEMLNSVEEHYSIAIDASWGDGKTFFVKQTKLVLDSYNQYAENDLSEEERKIILDALNIKSDNTSGESFIPQVAVYYNAWMNDNDKDPMLSLIYEIAKDSVCNYPRAQSSEMENILLQLGNVLTNRDVKSLINSLKSEDILETIRNQKSIEEIVKNYLESLLPERGNRLVIIVDELDRCKPSFAVQLLEEIKHYFDIDSVTFVFAINSKELQASLKKYYGDQFDSCRYLDRFFNSRVCLPKVSVDDYLRMTGSLNSTYNFDKMCELVMEQLGMSMREVGKYESIVQMAASRAGRNSNYLGFADNRGYSFGFMVVVPLVIGLEMMDINAYHTFINGTNPQPLINLFSDYECTPVSGLANLLLTKGESYEETTTAKKVSIESKLNEVYNAIFNNHDPYEEVEIGELAFSIRTKNEIMSVASLLSNYANYDE